jgi:dienelactone hydrolase
MPFIKTLFSSLCVLYSLCGTAQHSTTKLIEGGTYGVGFFDTIIHTNIKSYNDFGYHGMEPMFVKVWHPIEKNASDEFLSFESIHRPSADAKHKSVFHELLSQTDTIIKNNLLAEELFTWEPLNFGELTTDDILDSLMQLKTNSVYHILNKKSKFPVIVYHHGTQGCADENHLMAEFFASRGYIFVAANFHLPHQNMIFGLTETTYCTDIQIKSLLSFAESLTRSNKLFYIGHSWGAQVGWQTLHEKGLADAFVSLETTIEFKTDTNEIEEKWPCVYESLVTLNKKINVPVLLLANTGNDKPFSFFKDTGTKSMIEASAKQEFLHESYTSLYLWRYFLEPGIHQPDAKALENQIDLYEKHLLLIHAYLQNCHRKKIDLGNYSEHFYITQRK